MNFSKPLFPSFILAAVASSSALAFGPGPSAKPALTVLNAFPTSLSLIGRYDEARVLVDGALPGGKITDMTARVKWVSSTPAVATVDDLGIVRPAGDGKAVLTAEYQGHRTSVPVTVKEFAKGGPPRFIQDVMPVLSRAGCNGGACHGAAQGKGGFKISIFGYDPDFDAVALKRGTNFRRVNEAHPEMSLLLRKASLAVAHKGGLRLRSDSAEYRVVADWIAAGCPGPTGKEPTVTKLDVTPRVRTLAKGEKQRFRVRAQYSDGTSRDVTPQTLFTASDESVASVVPTGEATANGPGEGAVLIRYASLVATARVISPFGTPGKNIPSAVNPAVISKDSRHAASLVDQMLERKIAQLGLTLSQNSGDSDYLRRVYLDTIGIVPTVDETRTFLADTDPDKRARVVDQLLERPEFVDFWSMKWGDILKSSRKFLNEKGLLAFNHWIRQSVAENKPWDQFSKEIILAKGNAYEYGPANFYRTATGPEALAETTSQVFLGVRIQCAKCHNHPYERWTQNHYYGMSAFFARIKASQPAGTAVPVVSLARGGEVRHLKTGKETAPAALDAPALPMDFNGDRRENLAAWITSGSNPYFGKEIVNRIWRHFMGRGLVEPVDDLRATNPASNEELFDWLAKDLAAHNFDLKHVMRTIVQTRAYQRSSEPVKGNELDTKYLTHFPFKRLGAEQLLDALASATGVGEKYAGYPAGTHAAQLVDFSAPNYFLELFGKPARNITCECERVDEPSLGQVLHLMNNQGLNQRISDKNGRLAKLLSDKATDQKIAEELYLSTVCRQPSATELKMATTALTKSKNRQQTAEDILWALINSKEFVFNH